MYIDLSLHPGWPLLIPVEKKKREEVYEGITLQRVL